MLDISMKLCFVYQDMILLLKILLTSWGCDL